MISLREQANLLPSSPGIYIFRNRNGRSLYIGKAKKLRTRVLQYINGQDGRPMVTQLLKQASLIDFTLTATEKGALILEASEIMKSRPKFNIRLLDGTQFLHFCLDQNHPWPMLTLERFPQKKKGVRYFGPFPDATAARKTLEFINKMFPLRTCSDQTLKRETRPCLQYHMKRCLAPCVALCSASEYQAIVDQLESFLLGNNDDVVNRSKQRMSFLASEMRYEEAAIQRDLIKSIQKTLAEEQRVANINTQHIDVWGIYQVGNQGFFSILSFRKGRMQQSISIPFSNTIEEKPEQMLSFLLNSWYWNEIPHEIIVPWEPSSTAVLMDVLSERAHRKVRIIEPKRGEKVRVSLLAQQNAKAQYEQKQSKENQRHQLLLAVQKKIHLSQLPGRIECFDNSNLQGTDPVAAMVVFIDGIPVRKMYRRFRIKNARDGDDCAMMDEVLTRRFTRSLNDTSEGWEKPNLLIVDGGRAQVNVACHVLEELAIDDVAVIGISKPRTERKKGDFVTPDKIILPNRKDAMILSRNDPVLLLFQRIRDETHKTAIEYQRQVRSRRKLESSLAEIPGIGLRLQKNLIRHFGSVSAIQKATRSELQDVPLIGKQKAEIIFQYFHSDSS